MVSITRKGRSPAGAHCRSRLGAFTRIKTGNPLFFWEEQDGYFVENPANWEASLSLYNFVIENAIIPNIKDALVEKWPPNIAVIEDTPFGHQSTPQFFSFYPVSEYQSKGATYEAGFKGALGHLTLTSYVEFNYSTRSSLLSSSAFTTWLDSRGISWIEGHTGGLGSPFDKLLTRLLNYYT